MSWLRKRITIHVAFAFNGAISFEWLLLLVVGSARIVPAMFRLPACACLCVSHVKAGFSPSNFKPPMTQWQDTST
jgi:hypothetical protein